MKYMLMMHAPRGTGQYQIAQWAPEDFKAHMNHMHDLNRDLKAAGEWIDAQGLTPPGEAKLIRADASGAPVDGPFAETKEFLVGFWFLDVDSEARALEIAARASTAPGPGGKPLNMPIEVRRVMELPPPKDV